MSSSTQGRTVPIVMDAGPLIALMNAGDDAHKLCVAWLETVNTRRIVVPVPVLTEVCQVVASRGGAHGEAQFLEMLADSDQFSLYTPGRDALRRMAVVVRQYGDFPLEVADASVIVAAENLRTAEVATLDRRHFRVVKPVHVAYFDLHPHDYDG